MNYHILSLITLLSLGSCTSYTMYHDDPERHEDGEEGLDGDLIICNSLNEPVGLFYSTSYKSSGMGGGLAIPANDTRTPTAFRNSWPRDCDWGPTINLNVTTEHTRQQHREVIHQLGTYIIYRDAHNNLRIRRSE